MFSRHVAELTYQKKLLLPKVLWAHTKTCPTQRQQPVCPRKSATDRIVDLTKGPGASSEFPALKRALKPGPVRYGFIPEEWFHFFTPITGYSGPFILAVVLTNYLVSKEIYVMEHEYYLGISIFICIYYATTKFGPDIGKSLDAEVDAIQKELEKGRQDEKNVHINTIKRAKESQHRAQGQKILIDAKKENISMQLEAIYRERLMEVYNMTKGRLDYHIKKNRLVGNLHQKWMILWILDNVRKSITPQFEQEALDAAIRDLATLAGKSTFK